VALQQRYGRVCAVGVGPLRYLFLFGPDAHRELFAADIDRFSWREVTKSLIPVDGDTAIVVSDGDDHRRRRRVVQPAFSVRRLDGHLPLVAEEVNAVIDRWSAGDEVEAYEALRSVVRRVVMRALFGERLVGQADELGRRLEPALAFVELPVPYQVHVGPRWRRVQRARQAVDELVFAEIEARRRGDRGEDVLSWLLDAADPEGDGARLTDEEVRDQVISLIAGGYATTSAAVGWTVWAALANAGVWERVRAEVGETALTAETLRSLTYLDGVVNESLRLWPPGVAGGRQVLEPFDALGIRIPAGPIALYSPYVTQRMPDLWPDPLAFRPERWDKDAPGYAEPAPLSFVPFGAGPRRCIGFALAIMEIKVVLAELVRRTDLELLTTQEPGGVGVVSMHPRGGVPVRVRSVRPAARAGSVPTP